MDHFFEKLGIATRLLAEVDLHGSIESGYIVSNIMVAIAHEQIRFGFDDAARPVCFWTWAYLAPDVERRLMTSSTVSLHMSEWNEGGNLWIVDFVAPHGHLRSIIEYMHRYFSPAASSGYSMRRYKDGAVRKINGWGTEHMPRPRNNEFRLPDTAFAESKTSWLQQRQMHDKDK
jgi:hemolysin-activating ACP:hemolysin acyltransferase